MANYQVQVDVFYCILENKPHLALLVHKANLITVKFSDMNFNVKKDGKMTKLMTKNMA